MEESPIYLREGYAMIKTIHAVYEGGVFRPTAPVELPEKCEVEFEPRIVAASSARNVALAQVYELLSRRFTSGETDVAARHNEHQP